MVDKKIKIKPFDCDVLIIIDKSIKDGLDNYNKFYKIKHTEDSNEHLNTNGMFMCLVEDGLVYYTLFLKEKSDIGIIVHECFHAVMSIAKQKGCIWDDNSDEWYAYCLKETFNDVMKIFNKKNK